MKIMFSWKISEEFVFPYCTSDNLNKDDISILSCLLMDDGGIPYIQSIPWIQKGIEKIDPVVNGKAKSASWDREAWGALITINGAKIYSLFEEDYFEEITLEQLRIALISWMNFIKTRPEHGKSEEIEL
ncbi:hypothetical protein OQJ68_16100 [Microbulbifer thermotolerans]|uniref:Uncharacterized protein n=1 Tax=Microbulbifer thermotolerans TaxID=252514 RepID=A0AB35I0L8_MICTH|nr:hypothetical protein [Microbulbifer thermotolerans]MCX2803308.1 hypothetical protein [Microbulbifer thermotolerans]